MVKKPPTAHSSPFLQWPHLLLHLRTDLIAFLADSLMTERSDRIPSSFMWSGCRYTQSQKPGWYVTQWARTRPLWSKGWFKSYSKPQSPWGPLSETPKSPIAPGTGWPWFLSRIVLWMRASDKLLKCRRKFRPQLISRGKQLLRIQTFHKFIDIMYTMLL